MRRWALWAALSPGLGCGDPGGSTDTASVATASEPGTAGDASAGTGTSPSSGASVDPPTTVTDATVEPTGAATSDPTADPSGDPTADPGGDPTVDPSATGSDTGPDDTSTGVPANCSLSELLPAALFEEMFPQHDDLYSHDALLAAAAEYPAFANEGSEDDCRREIAAFLANIGHETTGGWADAPGGPYAWGLYFTQEVGCEEGACTGYCDANNVQYPCAPGKTYHGRGPIQLSWNYNYGQAADALGEPLLTQPELVATDGAIAFRTGLWFWMTAQPPKPSAHDVIAGLWQPSADDVAKGRQPGFGMTVNIINGGLECGQPTGDKVKDRVGFYMRFTDMLGVDPGAVVYCDSMQPY